MKFKLSNTDYTPKMESHFIKRTTEHIKAVQFYCDKIEKYNPKLFGGLWMNSKEHDQNKFWEPERVPYIFITWIYRCKSLGVSYTPPEEMKKPMDVATAHHIKTSKHHPEYWSKVKTNLVNPDARDEASQVIDATKMPDIYIAEMVADWFAVGEERHNPVKAWADKNVGKRWVFTPTQTKLIYELLEDIK